MGWFLTIVVLFVGVAWGGWVFQDLVLPKLGVTWDAQKLGLWGDSFGALNSLFASLGFVAAIFTLRLQQREISRNRQNQHKEDFDKSFFQLLELFREARKEVRFQHKSDYIVIQPAAREEAAFGLEAFRLAWYELRNYLREDDITKEEAAEIYRKKIHNRAEATLGPYFRLFYTILLRIREDTNLSQKEKIYYGNLFRAQLSSHEVAVAALNGLSPFSADFDSLITEFRLLKYSTQMRRKITLRYYPSQAFEGRD